MCMQLWGSNPPVHTPYWRRRIRDVFRRHESHAALVTEREGQKVAGVLFMKNLVGVEAFGSS